MKHFLLTLAWHFVALLMCTLDAAQADGFSKDLKINLDNGKPSLYQVAFCYRSSSSESTTGHAFLAIGKWTGNKLEVQGYGFYPAEGGVLGLIAGSGEVRFPPKDERIVESTAFLFQDKPSPAAMPKGSCRVLKHVTAEKHEELRKLFSKWNESRYYLVGKNCVSMADTVAKSLGMKVPEATYILPKSYVERLWQLNGGVEIGDLP